MSKTDYKYFIDSVEVFPVGNSESSIKYSKNQEEIFFTTDFVNEITFTGSDYLIFKADYDLADYCKQYEFIIEQKCNHVYEVKFMGYFALLDGKWDFDRCTFKVKPTIQDKYTCIKQKEETEINLLESTITRHAITSDVMSFVEFAFAKDSYPAGWIIDTLSGHWLTDDTFTVNVYAWEAIILPVGIEPVGWTADVGNIDYNEVYPDDGYVKWVRAPSSITITINPGDIVIDYIESYKSNPLYVSGGDLYVSSPQYGQSIVYFKKTFLKTLYNISVEITYLNALKLTDVINYVKEQCDQIGDLTSDFFTNATNPVTGIASTVNNIYLIQKSDAKRPNASNQATKGIITWVQLMETLYNYFNVRWYLDDTSNLNIEHISSIIKASGIDINTQPYLKTTDKKRRFEFDKNLIYKEESWDTSESFRDDFIGLPIIYSDACTLRDGKYNTKTYGLNNISTDVTNLQIYPGNLSDEGWMMFACDGSDKVIVETGIISGVSEINGPLSISSLHQRFWTYDRIFINGNMNGSDQTFDSAQKLKKMDKMDIILCCETEFDPSNTINTALGVANVDSATFKLYEHKLELDLYL